MRPENGPPLPLDDQLRLPPHFSSFFPLSFLCRNLYDLPGISLVHSGGVGMEWT
jgi:hypothetical protein